MNELRLLWLSPDVTFQGKGIVTAWGEEMAKQGWTIEGDVSKLSECDLVFFGSDSQLKQDLLSTKPSILFFWGWMPSRLLNTEFQDFAAGQLRLMAQCTRILVPSPTVMDQLACFGLSSQLCFPGVDTESLNVPILSKIPQVVFLSRLEPHKNLNLLLQALSLIEPTIPCLVVGPGDPGPYRKLAEELKLDVKFVELPVIEKSQEIGRSTVLVHPSSYEGWGLPPLEALYLSVPVIALDTPQMRWLLQEDAYYFTSVEGLAQSIVHVFQDPAEAQLKAAHGHDRIAKSLTLAHACERLWAHIHQTVKEFLGQEIRKSPSKSSEIYDAEHRRNWAYGSPTSPEWASGPARFDPTWERHWRAQSFIDALKECRAEHILDIGCGAVYPTIFARAGFQVHAVDISPEAVEQAKAIALKWGVLEKVFAEVGDASELALADSTFDAVVQGELWEHVPDVRKVISEGLRVLKPGGYLIASTPIGAHHYDPMHLRTFTQEAVIELLKPWKSSVRSVIAIAETEAEPSCFLVILEKPS